MKPAAEGPPLWAERLLAAALPDAGWRESVLGDLHEEHAFRARVSPRRARLWYAAQAVGLSARYRLRSRKKSKPWTSGPRKRGQTMARLIADARFAVRGMWKRPGLTFLVVTTLTVGLAALRASRRARLGLWQGLEAVLGKP